MRFVQICITGVTLCLCSGLAARAGVINVDFNGGVDAVNYTGQGALVTADVHYWNPLTSNPSTPTDLTTDPLTESDGTTGTAVTVTVKNVLSYNFAPGTNPSGNALIDDIYYNAGKETATPSEFDIEHLSAGVAYDLYLYGAAGYNLINNGYFQIGATQKPITGRDSAAPPLWVEGMDYVLFRGVVADGSGTIQGFWNGAIHDGAAFDGLQITESVPEPAAATMLLGLGAAALWRRRNAPHAPTHG